MMENATTRVIKEKVEKDEEKDGVTRLKLKQ